MSDDIVIVDTDVFSFAFRGDDRADVFREVLEGKLLAVSFTTVGELWYGAEKKSWGDRLRERLRQVLRTYVVMSYTVELSQLWGRIRADVEAADRSGSR